MSQTVIFIVGAIIFVITVYGVVMAGGLLLTRRQVEHGDNVGAPLAHSDVDVVRGV